MKHLLLLLLLILLASGCESRPTSASKPHENETVPPAKIETGNENSSSLKNMILYSIEMKLMSARMMQAVNKGEFGDMVFWSAVGRPPDNPDVYFILRVEGEPEDKMISGLFKDSDNRTVLHSFLVPERFAGKKFVIELWDDNSDTNEFWNTVIQSSTIELDGDLRASLPVGIVRTDASLNATFKFDGKAVAELNTVDNKFVGEFNGIFPDSDDELIDNVRLPAELLGVGLGYGNPIGVLTLRRVETKD